MEALQAFSPWLFLFPPCPTFLSPVNALTGCLGGGVGYFSFSFDIFTVFLWHLQCTGQPPEHLQDPPSAVVPPWETEATWKSAIFLHKPLFSSFSTSSATLTRRSCDTAGFQQRLLLSPRLPRNKEGTGWLLQAGVGRWLPIHCFRSEAANNEQW